MPAGAPISVAILQGAMPQDLKWQADNVEPTRELYTRLNDQALGARLIVWPEAALPQLANEIPRYLGQHLLAALACAARTSSWGSCGRMTNDRLLQLDHDAVGQR